MKCKHVRREGESCRLNNNCTYPHCPPPDKLINKPVETTNEQPINSSVYVSKENQLQMADCTNWQTESCKCTTGCHNEF